MVLTDVLTPIIRDSDVCIAHMIERMLQLAIKNSIPRRHIQQSVAREARHSSGVSASAVWFRRHLGPLPAVIAACCRLTAFVHLLDGTILLGSFRPVSD